MIPQTNQNVSSCLQGRMRNLVFVLSLILLGCALYLTCYQEKTLIQMIAYAEVFRSALLALFIFLIAYGSGSWLGTWLRLEREGSCESRSGVGEEEFAPSVPGRFFITMALGMGILGFLILLFGSFGLLKKNVLLIVFGVLFLCGIPRYIRVLRFAIAPGNAFTQKRFNVVSVIMIMGISLIVILYLFCSLPLPVNYDVLEYHLGALEKSLQQGTMAPQPYMFFSHLPFGIESFYAAGLVLEGENVCYTPKLLNFGFWLLALCGLYELLALIGLERPWRLLGLILFGMNRLVFSVALDAFVEMGQTVYVLAALVCWCLSWKRNEKKYLWLSFVFWGLALGAKYSILGLGIIPYVLILVPVGWRLSRGSPALSGGSRNDCLKSWIRISLLGVLILLCVFSPWMIRAFYHTGNPCFPFLSGLFPSEVWTPEQMKHYMDVNRSFPLFSAGYFQILLLKWQDLGFLYVLPVLLILLLYPRDHLVWGLGGFAVLGYLFWNLFLEPPARFLVPIVPVFIALTLLVLKRLFTFSRLRVLFLLPYIVFIVFAFQMRFVELFNAGYVKAALFCYDQNDFLLDKLGMYKEAADFINNELPQNSRLLFLYEARTFYIKRPVTTNTIFDTSPLLAVAHQAKDAEEIRSKLLALGFTYMLVNEIELNRLIHTYAPGAKTGLIRSLFQDPGANLTAFEDLYGPYHFDPRFAENRRKMRDFITLVRKNAVFERWDDRGLGFYISGLKEIKKVE